MTPALPYSSPATKQLSLSAGFGPDVLKSSSLAPRDFSHGLDGLPSGSDWPVYFCGQRSKVLSRQDTESLSLWVEVLPPQKPPCLG